MDNENIEEDVDGCILSIHVKNFFCHDNLEVNLNRNVNFIVGRNGSGKSAILTALVVGLGGRASATNRGSNLHSFIKKGQNSATIEIKIKNSSSVAYKHHVYGDFITIVRTITASGSSSYKVKSSSGEIISTKYEEVNNIIIAHDIQVDNPISVLNQDDARSFHASDSKKKYSLFRKATNLDQTEENYLRSLENCKKATAIWNKKNDSCIELEKEYKKWKSSHELLQTHDDIQAREKLLQNEYYWSEIADLEKEERSIQQQFDKQKAKMDKLLEKLNNIEKNYGTNTDSVKALKEELQEKTRAKSTAEQELRQLEESVREAQSSWRSARAAAEKKQELLGREKRKAVDFQLEIDKIKSGSSAEQREILEERVAITRRAAEAAVARYNTVQHEAAQARDNLARVRTQADHAAAKLRAHTDSIKQLKQQLRELESRGNDSLAVYGNHMVELCQRIKKSSQFSETPRGPIGAYIKVKEKKWGGAIEHIIGGSVQAFCVNSPEDSRKLFELMGQVYGNAPKPSVTCSKFLATQHDVRRHAVRAPGALSALDSVHVQDPVVANFLIDNIGVESILLVPENDDAIRLASSSENVPENCSKIVTLDGTEFYPAPNYRCYGGAARASRYLQVSTHERKRQVLAEIAEAERTLRDLQSAAKESESTARAAQEAERGAAERLQALLTDRLNKVEAAKAATAALENYQAPHYTVLEDELHACKEKLKSLQQELNELLKADRELQSRVEEYEGKINALRRQLAELTAACRTLSEEIEREQLKLEQGVTERRSWEQRLAEEQAKLAQAQHILDQKREDVATKVQEALTLCPRIENPRDKMIVTNELMKTKKKLKSIRSDGLTKYEVAEKLLQVEKKYRKTKQMLDKLKLLIEDSKATTDEHLKFCHNVQSYIARRVQFCFQSILNVRGYLGRMEIDHGSGALEIYCTGRESAAKRHAATTSSLSGGERSYSTVAFIMALWECVELPFYFMDEFDVFMDNVNRRTVMELLLDHALHKTCRQFVFLTPQDTAVAAQPRLSIHKMPDPRP